MKFQEIVKESEATRHEVYKWQSPNGDILSAPQPKESRPSAAVELQQLRNVERSERAARLAEIVNRIGLEKCEENDTCIAQLIEEPKHMSMAEPGLPLTINLIRSMGS